jgi:hypothetical protein
MFTEGSEEWAAGLLLPFILPRRTPLCAAVGEIRNEMGWGSWALEGKKEKERELEE